MRRYTTEIERSGTVPQELNLGLDVDPTIALATLQHLARYWSRTCPERKETRRRRTEHVTVVHEFGEVVANAGGLFFESPFVSNDEEWIVENESTGGFGAFVPKHLGAWLRVGSLIAVRREEGVAWGVGIVRRVMGDEQGNRYVGIEMLATGGAAVTVFPERPRLHRHRPFPRGRAVHPAAIRYHDPERRVHPAAATGSVLAQARTLEMHAYDRAVPAHAGRARGTRRRLRDRAIQDPGADEVEALTNSFRFSN